MQKKSTFQRILHSQTTPLVIILIVLLVITMILSSGVLNGQPASALFTRGFMSVTNLRNVFFTIVIQIWMLCGIGMLLMSGNVDLSLAGAATLSVMIFAWLHQNTSLPWFVCLIITLAIAAAFGILTTFLVVKLGFPAFIATIGMSSIYGGISSVMTNGYNITISQGTFLQLGSYSIGGVFPLTLLIALIVLIVCQFIISYTNFGRSILMTGGNRAAARLAGMNPNRVILILFIINALFGALGGLSWVGNIGTASPTALITDAPNMTAMSGAILGGISFMGGSGNLIGGFVAVLLLNVLENMLNVLGVNPYWIVFANGALLIVALTINFISEERARRKLLMH